MARPPGASSSSTRASTPMPAGCTPPARVDVVDEFAETIVRKDGEAVLPVRGRGAAGDRLDGRGAPTGPPTARWRARPSPPIAPITARSCAAADGKWVAFAMMYKPVEALEQSFLRTKADRLRQLPEGGRAEGQFLEQHPVRRRQGRGGLSAPAVHPSSATTASTTPSRSTGPTRPPTGRACTPCPRRRT